MDYRTQDLAPSGRNGLSPFTIHQQRRKYVREAYPLIDASNAFDLLYGNKIYYGKVDLDERAVILKEEKLKLFQDTPEISAVNFVVDAYGAFYTHINEAFSKKRISAKDTFLLDIKPKKAHIPALDEYESLVGAIMSSYISGYLVGSFKQELIRSYTNFVEEFVKFSDLPLSHGPFTLTRFLKSNFCPNLCSGLIVEIANAEYDDDAIKYERYLTDKNFDFYQNAARKFGFKIDYNVPWRLIADIKSSEMRQFMLPYGITSADHLFSQYYSQSVDIEASFFSNLLENYYNQYIEKFPHYRKPRVVLARNSTLRELVNCKYENRPIQQGERWQAYDVLYHYMLFRSREESMPFNYRFIRSRVAVAKKIEKRFDMARAMRYINDEVFKNSRV